MNLVYVILSVYFSGTVFDDISEMKTKGHPFGNTLEAVLYPLLLVLVMWLSYWADHVFFFEFYKLGVFPQSVKGLSGIILMPLIHSKSDIYHVINNSFPTLILLGALIYFYRKIALKVFVFSWVLTGVGVWLFAGDSHAYHIGMSGVIYALAAFLFSSGVLRKFLPLQGISLFVIFIYGSMIWGIFPIKPQVSWQGHLSGMMIGFILAFVFRRQGPQRPKYQYEIERELGIDPPDLEGIWMENKRRAEEEEQMRKEAEKITIIYNYKPSNGVPPDEIDQR